jgi:hypothetical protein
VFTKEWTAEHEGHRIVVHNSWGPAPGDQGFTSEAKLYVDGAMVDFTTESIALGDSPAMRGRLTLQDGSFKEVEVYCKSGLLTVMAKICIDGVQIAGDDF